MGLGWPEESCPQVYISTANTLLDTCIGGHTCSKDTCLGRKFTFHTSKWQMLRLCVNHPHREVIFRGGTVPAPFPCLPATSGQGAQDGRTPTAHTAASETAHLRKESERGFDTIGRWTFCLPPILTPQSSCLPVVHILVRQAYTESLSFPSFLHRQRSRTLPDAAKWHSWTPAIATLKSGKSGKDS